MVRSLKGSHERVHEPFAFVRSCVRSRNFPVQTTRSRTGPFVNRSRTVRSYFSWPWPPVHERARSRTVHEPFEVRSGSDKLPERHRCVFKNTKLPKRHGWCSRTVLSPGRLSDCRTGCRTVSNKCRTLSSDCQTPLQPDHCRTTVGPLSAHVLDHVLDNVSHSPGCSPACVTCSQARGRFGSQLLPLSD